VYSFSGVSWTWSGNLSNTDQISSWQGSGRERDSDKVPSRIIYDSRGRVVGWGFASAAEGTFQVQWFKLLLSNEAREKGGAKVGEAQAVLQKLGKQPVDVVADYLKQLWQHAVEQIELKLTRIAFENMDLKIVLTVPANWDHRAQERTKKAAIKAGITAQRSFGTPVLKLVTEPEAAALAAWKEAGLKWRPDFKVCQVLAPYHIKYSCATDRRLFHGL
jgi:molecular chaperone DnaK (HSP70)